ncbi:MAG: hypothetical protein AB7C91_11730 [Sphaerochaeta sp.]|uniref:hypothetical protein n=1 Tax=Sphaerochaeta sp. TaxID=1972642 RepID=UPI003D0D4C2E
MKHTRRLSVCLVVLFLGVASLGAQDFFQPYLGFEKGKAEIKGEQAPYVRLSLGTPLSDRVSVETFLVGQLLSDFPDCGTDLTITEVDSAFALMSGLSATVRLFRDATFNPMAQLSIGNMAVGHAQAEQDFPQLESFFYSSVASGLELHIFKTFTITVLSGYRFAPHEAVVGLSENTLCGPFSSVRFQADFT